MLSTNDIIEAWFLNMYLDIVFRSLSTFYWNMISTKPRPPQNYYLIGIDYLVGKSSLKRRTLVFSFYIIGEMFKTNELSVDTCTLTAKFSFCVFIFSTEYAMTRHETKDNARLVDSFLFLKHHNNSGIFCFL